MAHPIRRTFYVQAPTSAVRDEWIASMQTLLNEDTAGREAELKRFCADLFGERESMRWGDFAAGLREVRSLLLLCDS